MKIFFRMYLAVGLISSLLPYLGSVLMVGSSMYNSRISAACPCTICTELVDIQMVNPHILVELRYATTNNFTGQVIYDFDHCFLLKCVADLLDQIQRELETRGLGLKIWDGLRPMSAQQKMWDIVQDERYVSNPANGGGRHTRGTTVDLTLVNQYGEELEMPTEFDNFTERAHRTYMGCSSEAIKNREILREIMERYGFVGIETEWWHFDLKNWQQYPTKDVDIKMLMVKR